MGARIILCGPGTLLPPGLDTPYRGFPIVEVTNDIEAAVKDADVVMALRLQKERMQSGVLPSLREFINGYKLDSGRLKLAKSDAIVMHPGPVNEEIEISREVSQGGQSVIQEQVANGVAVRMALLYLISGGKEL